MKIRPSTTLKFLLIFLAATSSANGNEPLIFGVVPQLGPEKTESRWKPLVDYLSRKAQVEIRFATDKNISAFNDSLSKKTYDFVYSNPFHYVTTLNEKGYRAFAKEKDQRLTGIVVVRKNQTYSSLLDLENKTIAFPSKDAFAATMIPRAIIRSRAITVSEKIFQNHDQVYRAVLNGTVHAGGGIATTLDSSDTSLKSKLRILWRSDGYTPHPFSVSPKVQPQTVEKVTQALTRMHQDAEGKAILRTLNINEIERARR